MNRITARFAKLKAENRAGLIPFIMGGDPDMQTCGAILKALPQAGADVIEIGMPFSDPMADGPIIQAAGLRALQSGATIGAILAMVQEFRQQDQHTPIILMGYYNPIFRRGLKNFCQQAVSAGVDGVIIVDLPPEEETEFANHARAEALAFIRLIAPTSSRRIASLVQSATGFIYYISIAGVTGAKTAELPVLEEKIAELRKATSLPIAVGFGIKTPQQVKEAGSVADAVVVGSALVEVIAHAGHTAPQAAAIFLRQLTENPHL